MNNLKIKIEDYDLVHSGVVIQIGQHPITVTLPDEIEGDYTIIFSFKGDETKEGMLTQLHTIDKFTLSIEFINSDKAANVGNIDLIPIGTLRNKELFLQYRVFSMNEASKTLTFNFFTGKEVTNGDK